MSEHEEKRLGNWFTGKSMLRIGSGLLALAAVATVIVAGGSRERDEPRPQPPHPTRTEVDVLTVHPQRAALPPIIQQSGQIEGVEQTALYAKISGFVQACHVDVGDPVRKGQLLAELRVPELVADVHQKQSMVRQDEAQIVQAQEALRAAEANVAKAEANVRVSEASRIRAEASFYRWRVQHSRYTRLVKSQTISQEELDVTTDQLKSAEAAQGETIAAVTSAKAAWAESKAQRDKGMADIQVAEAALRVVQADLERAEAILGYARIEAPYDGVVCRRPVNTGAYVQAPASGTNNAPPLFEVARIDVMRIVVDVPEVDGPWVRNGSSAVVHIQALSGQEFGGRVVRSSWTLNNQTRTLRTEIDLPNPEGRLRPGMYVTAHLHVERPAALTLPCSAVFQQDDRWWLVCVESNKAVRTPVRLGVRQNDRVEVLLRQAAPEGPGEPATWKNFTGAELVVLDNPQSLIDGQEVRLKLDEPSLSRITQTSSPRKN